MGHKLLFMGMLLMMLSCKNEQKSEMKTSDEESKPMEVAPLKLSLAEWSFNKDLFAKKMDNLDFAKKAAELGFEGVEYVNQFFPDKAKDMEYLAKMNQAASVAGVKSLLIMIDGEGDLGETDAKKRNEAVENHKKWVDAAVFLGCHSIRVNARGTGTEEEVANAAVEGLKSLSAYAAPKGINIIVENHGGYSSSGKWLTDVMAKVNLPNCGTLPDFGNFCIEREPGVDHGAKCIKEYDRYKGVEEMIVYAKALSAKSMDFDSTGNETTIDYARMIDIAKKAGYSGYIGVEYEGERLGEEAGVIATRDLIKKLY